MTSIAWITPSGSINKPSPDIDPVVLVIDAIDGADPSALIGQHREGQTALDHLR